MKNPFIDLFKFFKSRFFGEESEKNIELREILIEDQPSFSKEELKAIGISDSTVRFSIGLENIEDLIKDIEQAVK